MRRAELGRKFLHTGIVLLVALFFVQCDKEDDYVYPDVLTDFMDLHTNDESVIDYIRPDVSGMLSLNHRLSGQGLKEDTVYRAVGMYSLPDAEGRTSVYSVSLVYAEPPFRLGEGLTLLADPLNIESVYRGLKELGCIGVRHLPVRIVHYEIRLVDPCLKGILGARCYIPQLDTLLCGGNQILGTMYKFHKRRLCI